ncbi:MAG: GTPase HflX [Gammaproteobacteria bacterium]|nr:GTPase HflX [Gammaproteobacteria bacterium]
MFERYKNGERAVLVYIEFQSGLGRDDLKEFLVLVASAGAERMALVSGTRKAPDPKYFVGRGKAEEIRQQALQSAADLLIFNHELTPSQERNLEQLCKCRVVGRSGLILDIFAQRARSHEGKLQVELAQLRYMSTRLVRGWTHLERQKGGIGLRGPGETQLETDRRLLSARIKQVNKRLEKVHKQRRQSRQARRKADTPTVSLVGYTNAGKSSLFNALTGASVYTADQLFATLDPTLRQCRLSNNEQLVLADTVGFIQQLPHDLVAAFRATLQETKEADLLLHVIDANDGRKDEYQQQVNKVLADIGAEGVPQLLIFNKIDLLDREPKIDRDDTQHIKAVSLSAKTGAGLELLIQAMSEIFRPQTVRGWLDLPPQAGRIRAQLFERGAVVQEKDNALGGWHLEVEMPSRDFEAISRHEGLKEYTHKG